MNNKKYKIIYADPPWEYSFSGTRTRAITDYKTLSKQDICNFNVSSIADENAVLLMWVTFPKLDWAFDVIKAWGFEYKTNAFTWIKLNKKTPSLFWGMGYYTRSNAEICLLATKGKTLPRLVHNIHSVVQVPVEKHSKKPDIFANKIVQLFGDIPRIELFARDKKEGWDVWGNELTNDINL